MSELLETRSVQADASIRARKLDDGGWELSEGQSVISIDNESEARTLMKMAVKIAKFNPTNTTRIAFIGAGTCWLPRVCGMRRWGATDIYELRQSIVDWVRSKFPGQAANWNFVAGDYKTTLTGMYDVIVWHLDRGEPDLPLLQAHLNPGGLLLTGGD